MSWIASKIAPSIYPTEQVAVSAMNAASDRLKEYCTTSPSLQYAGLGLFFSAYGTYRLCKEGVSSKFGWAMLGVGAAIVANAAVNIFSTLQDAVCLPVNGTTTYAKGEAYRTITTEWPSLDGTLRFSDIVCNQGSWSGPWTGHGIESGKLHYHQLCTASVPADVASSLLARHSKEYVPDNNNPWVDVWYAPLSKTISNPAFATIFLKADS